jgi:hypothetical protein
MKITEVLLEKQDKSKSANRIAALDKDGDKVLWKDVLKDPTKAHAEIEVDGIDYKLYVDDVDNNMYVFDPSRGLFVRADQNFVRRAFGKNLSARLSPNRDRKFGDKIRAYFDKNDVSQAGSGQAAKSGNIGGVMGSRIGGHIDNLIKRAKNKKTAQSNWTNVYAVNPPKPNDTVIWLTKDGKKATGKVISELGGDTDGDGVPELSVKMAGGGTVAIQSTAVISINGIPLQKNNMGKPQGQQNNDPGNTGLSNPLGSDPGDTGLGNPLGSDPAAI